MANNDTIAGNSHVGERLGKIKKAEAVYLHIGKKKTLITDRISIGRSRDNHIIIDDHLVSRNHAVIQKIREAYFITDLNSTNGVLVNGEKIIPGKYIRIKTTDVITIGRTELKLLQA